MTDGGGLPKEGMRVRRFGVALMIVSYFGLVAHGIYIWQTSPEALSWPRTSIAVQETILDELQTVTLANCTLKRYGSRHGGGYLMCANLLDGVVAAYSYGIDREDNWGCQVSRALDVPVHQYDCFTTHRPRCEGGHFIFHDECVGAQAEILDGRRFDTIAAQIARNGDTGKAVLLKMDVEGAEWQSLMQTPDDVLDRFVQIPMEFHLRLADDSAFLPLIRRLRKNFHLVNLHFNNNRAACTEDGDPLPSRAFQVLWVHKRVGILEPGAASPAPVSPLNAVDDPTVPECRPDANK